MVQKKDAQMKKEQNEIGKTVQKQEGIKSRFLNESKKRNRSFCLFDHEIFCRLIKPGNILYARENSKEKFF